jgi:hypothetical protein
MRALGLVKRLGFVIMAAVLLTMAAAAETARGRVFEDLDQDGVRDEGEPGIAGVPVSNGLDVVRSGDDGAYELPVEEGTVLFLTKPAGFTVPVDENGLPRFYYIHDPDGSTAELGLRYRGVSPSGPLPASVDFPLRRVEIEERFRVVLFADPQPQTEAEVGYIRDDVIDELIGVDAAFGMTLGDIMYDDLSLYPRYNRVVSQIGLPWYNVPGNHDLNSLAPDDRRSLETFKRVFGPTYYSFDYGRAHFVVLDDVDYLGSNAGMDSPHPRGQGKYEGRVSARQLEWLANDLALVPRDRLLILAMHIPFTSYNRAQHPQRHVANSAEVFALLEGFGHVLAVAGHMHTSEHHYFGESEGYGGAEPLHLHVISTVSGSWWGGPFDEGGVPTTDQRDGAPNGYYLMTVDGVDVSLRLKAARRPAEHQMRIMLDSSYHRYHSSGIRDYRMGQLLGSPIPVDRLHGTEIVVNLFDGGPRSQVICRIDDGLPVELERTHRKDPFIEELFLRNPETKKSWVKSEPSSHLWVARMPDDLGPGAHTITVRAEDEYGQVHNAHKVFEVVSGAAAAGD